MRLPEYQFSSYRLASDIRSPESELESKIKQVITPSWSVCQCIYGQTVKGVPQREVRRLSINFDEHENDVKPLVKPRWLVSCRG